MSEPDSGQGIREQARRLVQAARALVSELSEEGVCGFERIALPDPPRAAPRIHAKPPRRAADAAASPRPARREPKPPISPLPSAPTPAISGVAESVPWHGRVPTLEEVRDHLGACERCGLAGGRSSIVFGEGNPRADLMFIGEGPGEQEDLQGRPFVGRAGELLTQMIEKGIGISRNEVYICNIVKCRPPQNRNPLPPEVHACRPFLDGQIRAVAPRVIVTLGKPAASLLLDREVAITRVRGTWQDYQGIPLMPTLHPAYVLRQYTAANRRAVWQDLKAAFERSRG